MSDRADSERASCLPAIRSQQLRRAWELGEGCGCGSESDILSSYSIDRNRIIGAPDAALLASIPKKERL